MQIRVTKLANSLLMKVLLVCVGLMSFVFLAEVVLDTWQEAEHHHDIRIEESTSITQSIARAMEPRFRFMGNMQKEVMLAPLRNSRGVKGVSLIDRNATYKLDGDITTGLGIPGAEDKILLETLKLTKAQTEIGDDYIKVTEPLFDKGVLVAAVMVEFEIPTFKAVLLHVMYRQVFLTLPIFLVGIGFAVMLSMRLTRPLKNLEEAAIDFANGNLDRRIAVVGNDEVQRVGEAFNSMASALQGNIEEIQHLAYVDRVTRLPNRAAFSEKLLRTVNMNIRNNRTGALLFIDLDGFKKVNDDHGHDFGDQVLSEFAQRLAGVTREEASIFHGGKNGGGRDCKDNIISLDNHGNSDVDAKQFFARLGGDEFVVIIPELSNPIDCTIISNRIIKAVNVPFNIDGKQANIGASIGIATFPDECKDVDELVQHADQAMYKAKALGKNRCQFYSKSMNDKADKRVGIENMLKQAFENKQMELYFQPRLSVCDNSICALEAIVCWKQDDSVYMLPEIGLITGAKAPGIACEIEVWAFEKLCNKILELRAGNFCKPCSIKISGYTLEKRSFALSLISNMHRNGIPMGALEIQIDEQTIISKNRNIEENLQLLRRSGVCVAIYNFGLNYANLERLSQVEIEKICIPKSTTSYFTSGNVKREKLAKSLLAVSRLLGAKIVAEGVNTIALMEQVRNERIDQVQGDLFCKPISLDELKVWLTDQEEGMVAFSVDQGENRAEAS